VPPIFCPEKGPETTLDLVAGSYTVTVTTSDAQVGAYKGTWPLSGDQGLLQLLHRRQVA
jgi:hypothetical protein